MSYGWFLQQPRQGDCIIPFFIWGTEPSEKGCQLPEVTGQGVQAKSVHFSPVAHWTRGTEQIGSFLEAILSSAKPSVPGKLLPQTTLPSEEGSTAERLLWNLGLKKYFPKKYFTLWYILTSLISPLQNYRGCLGVFIQHSHFQHILCHFKVPSLIHCLIGSSQQPRKMDRKGIIMISMMDGGI